MQIIPNLNTVLNAKRQPKQASDKPKYTGWKYVSTGILEDDYESVKLWESSKQADGLYHLNAGAIIASGEDGKPLVAHYTAAKTHVFRVFHDESDADRGFDTVADALMYARGYDLTTLDEDGNEVPLTDAMGNPIHVPGLFETCRGIEFRLLKHPTNGTFFWCDKWHCEEREGKASKSNE